MQGTQLLVSAMKGSRAKRGIVTKLSVSWAPDVYDPPVTSDSHTLRPHQRSSRKSHYKYKPPKGSSGSRSSSGSKKDKKHSHHSSSSSGSKRDKKPSYRSTNGGSSRTDTSDHQHRKAYGSSIVSRTDTTSVPEYHNLSPWQPPAIAAVEEATPPVPVLKAMEPIRRSSSCCKEPPSSIKAMEQIKRSSSCCKEPPLSMLSRQFVSAKYKGMFSFWSQNQLAS